MERKLIKSKKIKQLEKKQAKKEKKIHSKVKKEFNKRIGKQKLTIRRYRLYSKQMHLAKEL